MALWQAAHPSPVKAVGQAATPLVVRRCLHWHRSGCAGAGQHASLVRADGRTGVAITLAAAVRRW